jgi:preprotein translocase subunit SecE
MLPQVDKSRQFLKEVRFETKKVTWPSIEQSRKETLVVVVVVIIIAIFLFFVDFGLSRVIDAVMS